MTNPGQIALHVIPDLAFYKAVALVNPTSACLAAIKAPLLAIPTKPWIPAMFIILPQPFCCI